MKKLAIVGISMLLIACILIAGCTSADAPSNTTAPIKITLKESDRLQNASGGNPDANPEPVTTEIPEDVTTEVTEEVTTMPVYTTNPIDESGAPVVINITTGVRIV